MTDWDEMVQYISQAMEAVGEAHEASRTLQQETDRAAFELFRRKMADLEDHLRRLKTVLDNEEAYAVDELMDALSRVYSDRAADYRRTPRMRT